MISLIAAFGALTALFGPPLQARGICRNDDAGKAYLCLRTQSRARAVAPPQAPLSSEDAFESRVLLGALAGRRFHHAVGLDSEPPSRRAAAEPIAFHGLGFRDVARPEWDPAPPRVLTGRLHWEPVSWHDGPPALGSGIGALIVKTENGRGVIAPGAGALVVSAATGKGGGTVLAYDIEKTGRGGIEVAFAYRRIPVPVRRPADPVFGTAPASSGLG